VDKYACNAKFCILLICLQEIQLLQSSDGTSVMAYIRDLGAGESGDPKVF